MKFLFSFLLLGLTNSLCSATTLTIAADLRGPFLFWGHKKVNTLQPSSLVETDYQYFVDLYKDAKAIVVFVRNSTEKNLDGSIYPKLKELVHSQGWAYLPQKILAADPVDYNFNVKVINLKNVAGTEDDVIVNGFNDAVTKYGEGSVLGILANSVDLSSAHYILKRQAKAIAEGTTTAQPPNVDETEESFIYVAEGKKAALVVNNAPVLNISKNSYKLVKHQKMITFDDQTPKGYGRFIIVFTVDGEKLFLRFNFTIARGTWIMRAVEVESSQNKTILTLGGHLYNLPSAPVKFSYRCGPYKLVFKNGEDSLTLSDYQLQPWLNGASKFGDVYDCVGFTTAPIWAGILVTLFLCGILSIGLMALYDIKTPNKFESSRNKQLTFTIQE